MTIDRELRTRCRDCSVDVTEIGDWYMVHDRVWALTCLGPQDGVLCFPCLVGRLGRPLRLEDFKSRVVCPLHREPRTMRAILRAITGREAYIRPRKVYPKVIQARRRRAASRRLSKAYWQGPKHDWAALDAHLADWGFEAAEIKELHREAAIGRVSSSYPRAERDPTARAEVDALLGERGFTPAEITEIHVKAKRRHDELEQFAKALVEGLMLERRRRDLAGSPAEGEP